MVDKAFKCIFLGFRFVRHLVDQLSLNKFLVNSIVCNQLIVSASLSNQATCHYDDLICVTDGAQPVGNNNNGLIT